jgi:Toprim-like
MTFKEANKISIKSYLAQNNIFSKKEMGYYCMYTSIFTKEDHNPSLKVDHSKNLWYDFSTNQGGTLVDLVMAINQLSPKEALGLLEKGDYSINSFSFHRNTQVTPNEVTIKKMQSLQNSALTDYLCTRKIDIEIAKHYLEEIYYSVKGKYYFSVAFKNDKGGYELRNPYLKNCLAPKDITTIRNSNTTCDICLVFEGFMNFLSYLTLSKEIEPLNCDCIILNSTSQLKNMIDNHPNYNIYYCYLDNDNAGRQAVETLKQSFDTKVIDHSFLYEHYNDLNDMLCDNKIIKENALSPPKVINPSIDQQPL